MNNRPQILGVFSCERGIRFCLVSQMELWPTLLNSRKNFLSPSYLKEDAHPLGRVCCLTQTGRVFGMGALGRTQKLMEGWVRWLWFLTCCKVIFFFSQIPTPYPHSVMANVEDLIMPLDLLNQDQSYEWEQAGLMAQGGSPITKLCVFVARGEYVDTAF